MPEFKKILVVRTDRIGDVVLTIPAIRALRRKFPAAHICVWVSPLTKELVEGLSFIDEVITEDRSRGFGGFLRHTAFLRKKNFDLAVVYHTKKHTNAACFLAGIPHRLGYKNNKFGFLLNHPVKDQRHLGLKHEAFYCMDLLRAIGIEDGDFRLEVALNKDAESWAEKFFAEHGLVGKPVAALHPGATCPTRLWPADSYAALASRLINECRANIIIIGDKSAQPAAARIFVGTEQCSVPTMKEEAHTQILDLTDRISLSQLAAVLKRCRLLVSNDSGPVHLAAAVGLPVISLFLRSQPGINPERWRPLGPKSCFILNKKGEHIVLDREGKVISGHFDSISVDEVFLKAKAIISE